MSIVSPKEGTFISKKYGEKNPKEAYYIKNNLAGKPHLAIDISPKDDKLPYNIVSPIRGTVIRSGYAPGFGYHVRIKDEEGNIHLLAHMAKLFIKEGKTVSKDTPIGVMGKSGHAEKVHIHYEVRNKDNKRINPMEFLK